MKFISSILLTGIFFASPALAEDFFRGSGTFKCVTQKLVCGSDGMCATQSEYLQFAATLPITNPVNRNIVYERAVGNNHIEEILVRNVTCEFNANAEKIECVGQRSAPGSTSEKLVSVSLPGIAPLDRYISQGHVVLTSNVESAIMPVGAEFNFSGLCEFGRIIQGG